MDEQTPDYMQSFKIQLSPSLTLDLNKHIDQILKQREAASSQATIQQKDRVDEIQSTEAREFGDSEAVLQEIIDAEAPNLVA